ncbi:MAG: cysteine desulfurase family protein [Pirellula sp.]
MNGVYLDHNATTPIDPRVLQQVVECFQHHYGNAGSPHEYGLVAKERVHDAREQIGRLVGARRHEVYFTSGATESNNLALLGLADHGLQAGKRHIVSTQIEHKAVLEPLEQLKKRGFEITSIAPDPSGRVDASKVLAAIRSDTLLVSVMHVNNETGVVQPIGAIAEGLTERSDVVLHVDAAQGFGKVSTELDHPRIDLISISSHKIHGPVGVGALIARREGKRCAMLQPLMYGGGQEMGLRPGTIPVPLVVGFGVAAELASQEMEQRRAVCSELRAMVKRHLEPLHPVYLGDEQFALPHVVCVALEGWDADALIEEVEWHCSGFDRIGMHIHLRFGQPCLVGHARSPTDAR